MDSRFRGNDMPERRIGIFNCRFNSMSGYLERLLNPMSQFQNVQFCPRSRMAKILTADIPGVFRGLKFEPDAEIGQKGAF
jgi:hypothetical protein